MFKSSDVGYLKPSCFNSISLIFGIVYISRFNCLFKCHKLLRNCTQYVFAFGWTKYGAPHSESFLCSSNPRLTNLLTWFINISSCTISTGYGRDHTGFASSFNSKFTGLLVHGPNIPLIYFSIVLIRARSLLRYSVSRSFQCLVITFFKSDFLYFAYNFLWISQVQLTLLSELKHYLTYTVIQDSSSLIVSFFRCLKSESVTPTICSEHPFYGLSPPNMMCLENLSSSPSSISRYLPRIISYLLLVESSTWHFHVMIFVALNYGREKSTITISLVVNFRLGFAI